MLNDNIQPSTIGGIKRYAKQIKKTHCVPHTEALDISARSASFENFAHALKHLKNTNTIESTNQLFFSVYWNDPKNRNYQYGREVIEITLNKPLLEIITKSELRSARCLGDFRLASNDHFVADYLSSSQEEARKSICYAIRVLRFMEATGLKPSSDYKASYPQRNQRNRLPKSDHSTYWYDPHSRQFIFIDEPYLAPKVEGERAVWAKEHNWNLYASKWSGMYSPSYSNMFIATDASSDYDFNGLIEKIDKLPYPITFESWSGKSSSGYDTFVSPLAVTKHDKKRAIAKGTIFREPSSKTIPMRSWNAPHNERRPNAAMPIESHLHAAKLIKTIQGSKITPWNVNSRLSSIKSKLEDWFFKEYEKEVTSKYDLFYYGGTEKDDPLFIQAQSPIDVVNMLIELRRTLVNAYIDCEPFRRMIRKINTSITVVSKLL